MYGWDLECCILTLCLPSWCTMLINILALTFWWPQWARRQWCGVDCFVPPAVKTVARGSTPLGCEPGKPFCLWNGSLESSNVTAGRCDILTPASWRTVLKKKPNVFNIDNLGQDWGAGEGALENISDFISMRKLWASLEAAGWKKGGPKVCLGKCQFGVGNAFRAYSPSLRHSA